MGTIIMHLREFSLIVSTPNHTENQGHLQAATRRSYQNRFFFSSHLSANWQHMNFSHLTRKGFVPLQIWSKIRRCLCWATSSWWSVLIAFSILWFSLFMVCLSCYRACISSLTSLHVLDCWDWLVPQYDFAFVPFNLPFLAILAEFVITLRPLAVTPILLVVVVNWYKNMTHTWFAL